MIKGSVHLRKYFLTREPFFFFLMQIFSFFYPKVFLFSVCADSTLNVYSSTQNVCLSLCLSLIAVRDCLLFKTHSHTMAVSRTQQTSHFFWLENNGNCEWDETRVKRSRVAWWRAEISTGIPKCLKKERGPTSRIYSNTVQHDLLVFCYIEINHFTKKVIHFTVLLFATRFFSVTRETLIL